MYLRERPALSNCLYYRFYSEDENVPFQVPVSVREAWKPFARDEIGFLPHTPNLRELHVRT